MTTEPPPPPHASGRGITWRPLAIDDAQRLHSLYAAAEEASGQPWRTSLDDVAHEMASPETDLQRDTVVAEDAGGSLVASVWVKARSHVGVKHRGILFTYVRPGHEELEHAAIEWGQRRVVQRFDATGLDLPRMIRSFAEADDGERIRRYEANGFSVVRYFIDMTRDLEEPIPSIAVPPEIEIVTWSDEWIEPAWRTDSEAFRDHWGSMPTTLDSWRHESERPGFRPDLTVLAVAGGEVASYTRNGVYPEDWEVRGRREGWIDTLGTAPRWRRRGLASALIVESMRRFCDAGLSHAALGVDAENPTGALGIYTRLGFTEVNRAVALAKELPAV